jgi:eukaryotic-like serine/threonine-protein kinase
MVTPAKRIAGLTQPSSPSSGLVALSQQDVLEMPFLPGEIIAGKYEVQKLIGSGGMGYVVSALHVELGEVVALKFLRPEALAIEELIERFAREARAAAKIKSEHIARVFDVGALPDGAPFIVMEHLDGQDLCDVLHQQGPMPIKVAVEYVMQACEALAAAHAAGVVHRDIKPENLFLTRHAQGLDFIKILDFGISKVALQQGKRALVRTQMPLGSPVYMSPEQIRSSEQVDARTDIWSLGCVLFELLTGVVAFDEPSLMQLSAAILEHDPVPLREFVPDAPVELENVILRCLEKDVTKRYSNIAELAIALYPFAPRRSRISAERCYHALKNAGIECPDFETEIVSVFPPSLGEMQLLTSTQPVSGVMPLQSLKVSAISLPDLRTSAPATVNLEEELAGLRPGKKYKRLGWVALAALVAGISYFGLQARTAGVPEKSAAAALPSPAGVAAVTTTGAPTATLQAALPSPAVQTRVTVAGSSASATASSDAIPTIPLSALHALPAQHRPPAAPAKSAVAPHHRADGDEIDVGY